MKYLSAGGTAYHQALASLEADHHGSISKTNDYLDLADRLREKLVHPGFLWVD